MAEKLNYVVAHPWPSGGLSIYAYGSELQQGTLEDASRFLAYVQRQEPREQWAIYLVTFTRIDGMKEGGNG